MSTALSISPLKPRPLAWTNMLGVPLGTQEGEQDYDDLGDSPDWDTFPTPGVATNWALYGGVYTLEGSTPAVQLIAYKDYDFQDGMIECTVLAPLDGNDDPDQILAMRASGASAYEYVGLSIDAVNGLVVMERVGTTPYTLLTIPAANLPAYPFRCSLILTGQYVRVVLNEDEYAAKATGLIQSGRIGIRTRGNNSTPPIGVFSKLVVKPVAVGKLTFGLNMDSTLPVVSNGRSAGDVIYWGAGQWEVETDASKPIKCGTAKGPSKVVAGYKYYPHYPPWEVGKDVVAGDLLWMDRIDHFDTKVMRAKASLTLGEKWDYKPEDFDVVDDYEPWLGAYAEPDSVQLVTAPGDLGQWTMAGSTTSEELQENVLPGGKTWRITADNYDYAATALPTIAAGTECCILALIRPQTTPSVVGHLVINTEGINVVFNSTVYGSVVFNGPEAVGDVRYLPGGWMYLWMRFKPTAEVAAKQLRAVPSYAAGVSASMDVAYLGLFTNDYAPFPVMSAATRPADTAWVAYNSADYWLRANMEHHGTVMTVAQGHPGGNAANNSDMGRISLTSGHDSLDFSGTEVSHYTQEVGQGSVPDSDLVAGKPPQRSYYMDYSRDTTAINLSQTVAGETAATASWPTQYDGYYHDTTKPGVYLLTGGGVGAKAIVNYMLRAAAVWEGPGAFDPAVEFGPEQFSE